MLYAPISTQTEFEGRIRLLSKHGTGTREDQHIDFKQLEPMDDAREHARDIAQFANSYGGTLVIGVEASRDESTGRDTARGIAPIQGDQEGKLVKWTEKALSNYLYPAFSRPVPRFFNPWGQGKVMVLNVDPSATLVVVWRQAEAKHGAEYIYRTAEGREWFTPEEVAMRLSNWSARATRIKMEQVLSARTGQTDDKNRRVFLTPALASQTYRSDLQKHLYSRISEIWTTVGDLHEDEFCLKFIGDAGQSRGCLMLPYDYVNFAWKRADGQLALDLKVQIYRDRFAGWSTFRLDAKPPVVDV